MFPVVFYSICKYITIKEIKSFTIILKCFKDKEYLPSWLFSWASSHRPTTLMMARPASLAQIIMAGARGSTSSASAGILVLLSNSDGGLITALNNNSHCQSLHFSVRPHCSSVTKTFKTTVTRVYKVQPLPLRNAKRLGARQNNVKFERRVRAQPLYLRQNKEAWCVSERQQQQTSNSLALSAAQLTEARGKYRRFQGSSHHNTKKRFLLE